MLPVAGDLFAFEGGLKVFAGGLDLDHAASRRQDQQRVGGRFLADGFTFELVGREQTAIRKAGAPVLELDDAPDLGIEGPPDLVQERDQSRIVGGLGSPGLRGARGSDIGKDCISPLL